MRLGRWKNIVVCAWCGQATGAAVETLTSAMVHLHRGPAEVRSYVHLVPNRVTLPDAAARAGLTEIMKVYLPHIACVAVVVAGSGFWASAMQNAVIGMRVFLPRSFAFRLHSTNAEVAAWLPSEHTARTGIEIAPNELRELLDAARQWQLG
jgi:hypothetical protein